MQENQRGKACTALNACRIGSNVPQLKVHTVDIDQVHAGDVTGSRSLVVCVYKHFVYNCGVIESFASTDAERLFATGKSRRLPPGILRRAVMRLTQLDASATVDDLRQPPSNRLEALGGDRAGQWSVRINDKWPSALGMCFRFERGNAQDVEIVDCH